MLRKLRFISDKLNNLPNPFQYRPTRTLQVWYDSYFSVEVLATKTVSGIRLRDLGQVNLYEVRVGLRFWALPDYRSGRLAYQRLQAEHLSWTT